MALPSAVTASALTGSPELHFLPRCATLVRYGGGDDMRQGEVVLTLPLSSASLPEELRSQFQTAVGKALASAKGWTAAGLFAAEHLPEALHSELQWSDVALSVVVKPPGGDWANIYWHGWLFNDSLQQECLPYAVQRFPLCGVWSPSTGVRKFLDGDQEDHRACGWAEFRPADQHIHKVDCYAGGDRASTVQLYIDQGFDPDSAEAAVVADELESSQYHVGSDSARVVFSANIQAELMWAAAVDFGDPSRFPPSPEQPSTKPRCQATLLLVVSGSEQDKLQGWLQAWYHYSTEASAELIHGKLLQALPQAPMEERIREPIRRALAAAVATASPPMAGAAG